MLRMLVCIDRNGLISGFRRSNKGYSDNPFYQIEISEKEYQRLKNPNLNIKYDFKTELFEIKAINDTIVKKEPDTPNFKIKKDSGLTQWFKELLK